MSDSEEKALFQPDRRKNLRAESTDRRERLRPTKRLKMLWAIFGATLLILIFAAVYLINPKV
ncbi:MAG: hypothetical protein ACXVAX_07375 [Pseudobdellovibrio sp.]